MSRYSKTKIKKAKSQSKNKNIVNVYATTIYQRIPETNGDLHIISTEGDRLDNLAFQFYEDESLWWYIGKANGITTLNIPAGTSLRIPASTNFAKGN